MPVGRPAIAEAVAVGGYPEAIARAEPRRRGRWFEEYVAMTLERDVRDLTRNAQQLGELPTLLHLAAARVSGLLSPTGIARDAGMSRPTVQRYLTLLEQLFLLIRARAWSRNIGQRLIKAPKVWIPDTGLACHLLDYGQARFEADETALAGSLFENFVAMELVKQVAWAETNVRIYHLRTAGGREVDIVLERGDGSVCGIEVKLSATAHSRDFGALRHLQSKPGTRFQLGAVVYTGSETLRFGPGLWALPVSAVDRGLSPQRGVGLENDLSGDLRLAPAPWVLAPLPRRPAPHLYLRGPRLIPAERFAISTAGILFRWRPSTPGGRAERRHEDDLRNRGEPSGFAEVSAPMDGRGNTTRQSQGSAPVEADPQAPQEVPESLDLGVPTTGITGSRPLTPKTTVVGELISARVALVGAANRGGLKMRKPFLALLVLGLVAAAGLGLAACGSDSRSSERGTLNGTFASFPDYLDPALSYTSEGWTALYDTYIPLLTYAHADGKAGSKVVPGLARALPEITNGGKTYTLFLRKGLKYSDGTAVKASDFTYAVERLFKLNSGGSPFYTDIVGAEKFAETKRGGIAGIRTDDKTGEIVINLVAPRGTFINELGLMFAAPVPSDTPARNLTADPPPATGPYMITKSEPGRGWSYARNPQWTMTNSQRMPESPSGHFDNIDITVVRNAATQVNEVERGKADWMQTPPPADLYAKVKNKYEGTQFRVEPTINVYYFWMNTTQPPFEDLKVRQAVNYAIDTEALERIYAGSLTATHQILAPGMLGYREYDLYPHSMAKAKKLIAEANPSDREITVWVDNESPNNEAGAYYQAILEELGFSAKLKEISADAYFAVIGNLTTPDLDTGWTGFYEDYPHPNDFFQQLLAGESITSPGNTNSAQIDDPELNSKIAALRERQLGPRQEIEYAALDKAYMEKAVWAPYGNQTAATFVSSAIDLDTVIFNPTFGQDLTSFQLK